VTEDAPALWDAWVGLGGEGIVLKERTSAYRPGVRSPAWLKLKPKLSLEVVVTGGSADRVRWGDWGEAVMLPFRYAHPRTGHSRRESSAASHAARVVPGDASGAGGNPSDLSEFRGDGSAEYRYRQHLPLGVGASVEGADLLVKSRGRE
jgi:hypothetical protein